MISDAYRHSPPLAGPANRVGTPYWGFAGICTTISVVGPLDHLLDNVSTDSLDDQSGLAVWIAQQSDFSSKVWIEQSGSLEMMDLLTVWISLDEPDWIQ